ncbi:MAG TPA: helix-turn-helix domain-containing protein [Thermoplasmata archaeon]|jgi:predicted transcriptional regulator|nr:helix-turn-helix domain-containing protein [Thermoplasmata archaeon]
MDELLRQPTRRRIYDVVSAHPGASARDVQRLAGLAWGETAYHLDQLTHSGAVRRERGGRRDYYFRRDMTWDDRKLVRSLRSASERLILLVLTEDPGRTAAEVSQRTRLSLSTTSFHLRILVGAGTVEAVQDGNVRRYRTALPARVGELLQVYRDSFQDRLVDRFVETWSSLIR